LASNAQAPYEALQAKDLVQWERITTLSGPIPAQPVANTASRRHFWGQPALVMGVTARWLLTPYDG